MVLNSVPESETPPPPSPSSMASTFSTRSHPLHDFSLSNLECSINHFNHHHHHQHHHGSSSKNRDSGHGKEQVRPSSMIKLNASSSARVHHENVNDSSGGGNRGSPVISGTECAMDKKKKKKKKEKKKEKKEKKLAVAMNTIESSEKKLIGNNGIRVEKNEEKLKGTEGKPKLLIRIPARNKEAVQEQQCADVEHEEPVAARTWNLRPRRAVAKPQNFNEGAQSQPEMLPEVLQRKEFCLTLSKEEIEEDFLIFTGSRPPRRPKNRRARNVQKQLDVMFNKALEFCFINSVFVLYLIEFVFIVFSF